MVTQSIIAHCTGFRQNPSINILDLDPMNEPLPVASLLRRLAALIYDAFLMFAITLAYATLMLIVKIIFNGTDNLESIQPGPTLQWLSFVGLLISLGATISSVGASKVRPSAWRHGGCAYSDMMAIWQVPFNASNGLRWQHYHWLLGGLVIYGSCGPPTLVVFTIFLPILT